MVFKVLLIALGGAIGTTARYFVSGIDYKFSNGIFPVSTFIVNVTGSFIIGFLWGLFEGSAPSSTVRMFLFIGVLGGYTTFSSFSLETFNLLRDGEIKIALMSVLATNVLGILLVYAGFFVARFLPHRVH